MANFCSECGAKLGPFVKFCSECGRKIEPSAAQLNNSEEIPVQPQVNQPVPPVQPQTAQQVISAQPQTVQQVPHMQPRTVQQGIPVQPQVTQQGTTVQSQVKQQVQSPKQISKTDQFLEQKRKDREASKNTASKGKNHKKLFAVVAIVLVISFLVTAFGYPGFLRTKEEDNTNYFLTKTDKENIQAEKNNTQTEKNNTQTENNLSSAKVLKTEDGKINEAAPAITLCGVTIDAIPQTLASGNQEVSVSKLEDSVDENGVKCENYELNMGEHHTFEIPVEVTFPCTISEGIDPTVEHYNEETKEWEPLLSFVDETNKTVTAYFGSFSPARVSYLPIGVNPKIYGVVEDKGKKFSPKIGVSKNYWKILQRINPSVYSDEVIKFINDPENYAVDFPKLDENADAKAAYEAFTKSSTLWTFLDPMINFSINELPSQGQNALVKFIADNAESLGNAMNVIPFIIMSAQVAFDLSSGEPDALNTAAVNLYKNLITSSGTIYSLTTGYSHIGFTLTFFGVALFGMELDYLVDAAKAEQKANVKSVFESYYKNTVPFDSYHWYKVFEDAYWDCDRNADAAMKTVKEAVDEYCSQFWTRIYNNEGSDAFWETLSDSEYRKMFMNATPEDKALLTEQQKARVWDLIQKHSMKMIRRFMIERIQEDTRKELYSNIEMYNKEHTITIRETVNRDAKAKLKGYTVCFGYDFVPFPDWHINIPDDEEYDDGWRIDFDCTTYGYLRMGLPNQVLFYDSEADFNEAVKKGKRAAYMFPFNLDVSNPDPNVLVDINFGDPYQAKSDTFKGYDWYGMGYGGEISSERVNGAIEDAIQNLTIKLDKDGNFSASASGSSHKTGEGETGPNDVYSYSANAGVSLSGHIDKGTGEGTFKLSISVSYNHSTGSPYSGTDKVNATISIKGKGDISSSIDDEGTFDPVFTANVTAHRQGSWSHSKGTAFWDTDGHENINASDDSSIKILFIASN